MRLRFWSSAGLIVAGLVLLALGRAFAAGAPAGGLTFGLVFRGAKYLVCTIDPAKQDLRLFWDDGHGGVLGNFTALQKHVAAEGGRLLFAANAGMFDPASKPVGLLVVNGTEKSPLNLGEGYGNFYTKPNGVFAINPNHRAFVIESSEYPVLVPPAIWATQSGPLLVHGDDVNPDFMVDSKNRKVRSGVGVTKRAT